MRRKTEELKRRFLQAFEKNGGNISASCTAIGINRGTYYQWMENDAKFAASVSEIEERNLDALENVLFEGALQGDTAKLIFMLKCKGKKRGYGDTVQVGGINGEPIKIQWTELSYRDAASRESNSD